MDELRSARLDDISEIAKIHIEAFPGFFLTTLGFSFLEVMYRSFLSNPSGIFIVQEQDDKVCGFAVGSLSSSKKDRHLALSYFFQFFCVLAPAVLRHPVSVTRRIISRFFSTGEQPVIPVGSAFLRSIGVPSSNRGNGAAMKILAQFEFEARRLGASSIVLTTDELDNERALGFYTKQGYLIAQKFKQDDRRKMLLLAKSISQQPIEN